MEVLNKIDPDGKLIHYIYREFDYVASPVGILTILLVLLKSDNYLRVNGENGYLYCKVNKTTVAISY